jgi:hypothetical protein
MRSYTVVRAPLCFKKYDDVLGTPKTVPDIYVLELEGGKYYVGKTKNFEKRLKQHEEGDGSSWTKKYPPIDGWIEKENCADFDEDNITKKYMGNYGINNVRGGTYAQITLSNAQITLLEAEINTLNDECFKCGKKGHFAKDCEHGKKEYKFGKCNNCGKKGHFARDCEHEKKVYGSSEFRNNAMFKDPFNNVRGNESIDHELGKIFDLCEEVKEYEPEKKVYGSSEFRNNAMFKDPYNNVRGNESIDHELGKIFDLCEEVKEYEPRNESYDRAPKRNDIAMITLTLFTLFITVWSWWYWKDIGTEAFFTEVSQGVFAFFWRIVSVIPVSVISHPAFGVFFILPIALIGFHMTERIDWSPSITVIIILAILVYSGSFFNDVGTQAFFIDMIEGLIGLLGSIISGFGIFSSYPASICCLIPISLYGLYWMIGE